MSATNSEVPQALYENYCAFMHDLNRTTGKSIPLLRFGEFKHWWAQLPADSRAELQRDYVEGYAVTRNRQDVETIVRKHSETA